MRKLVVLVACFITHFVFADNIEEESAHKAFPMRCARIKLKRGTLEITRKWFQTMEKTKDELFEILEAQGIFVEAVFLDHIGEDDYLIYFIKEESLEKSKSVSHSERSLAQIFLNKGHQEYKRNCWEEKKVLEPLLNMDTICAK